MKLLKRLRLDKKLSINDLAQLVGAEPNALKSIENGYLEAVYPVRLMRLSKVLEYAGNPYNLLKDTHEQRQKTGAS